MSASVTTQTYRGPERRHFRVFKTMNSEYHCRDGVCVAVRNCHTGEFIRGHSAIGRKLSGSLLLTSNGVEACSAPDNPSVGEQLCFSSGHSEDPHDVLTSSLLAIERPPREIVAKYVS